MSPAYAYEFTPQALKEIKKAPKQIQKRIIEKLDFFVSSGRPLSFAQSLINFEIGQYRFRMGDWRIIFDLEQEIIVVLSVGHRKEIYK